MTRIPSDEVLILLVHRLVSNREARSKEDLPGGRLFCNSDRSRISPFHFGPAPIHIHRKFVLPNSRVRHSLSIDIPRFGRSSSLSPCHIS